MNYPKIKYIEALENYRLFIIFDNGEIKIYPFNKLLNEEPFSKLSDENLFKKAQKEENGYGVIWNDEIDISEYELWKNAINISSIEQLSQKIA